MKIRSIEIQNFKGLEHFVLETQDKNVLLLGENGSGKTSFVRALEAFIESSRGRGIFERNIFMADDDAGSIDVVISDGANPIQTFSFLQDGTSTARGVSAIELASKSKRFLEYKQLLRTYFFQGDTVNVFDFLVQDLLSEVENPLLKINFKEDWEALQKLIPVRNTKRQVQDVKNFLGNFNNALQNILEKIEREAMQFLNQFDSTLEFKLELVPIVYEERSKSFPKPTIWLKVKFQTKTLEQHHQILNEARLSAIAICLYFAAVLETPRSDLQILVLDDVLIGLDLNNRLPFLDILKMPVFKDYQVFLLTYDPVWFDLVQTRMLKAEWEFLRMYVPKGVPVSRQIVESADFLTRARVYAEDCDYKAAAVYARSAFERLLQRFCDDRSLKVGFSMNLKGIESEELFAAVCGFTDPNNRDQRLVKPELKEEIEHARALVLNPLSHAELVSLSPKEVLNAIATVRVLEATLEPHIKMLKR